jgi:hypothetical protein
MDRGIGKFLRDRVIEFSEFSQTERLTATNLKDARSECARIRIGHTRKKFNPNIQIAPGDVNESSIDAIHRGAANEANYTHIATIEIQTVGAGFKPAPIQSVT